MKQGIAQESIMKFNTDKSVSTNYNALEAEPSIWPRRSNCRNCSQSWRSCERRSTRRRSSGSSPTCSSLQMKRRKGTGREEVAVYEEELEREETTLKNRKFGKIPDMNTSLLPQFPLVSPVPRYPGFQMPSSLLL